MTHHAITRLETTMCSALDFGQGDLRITHCPFCGSTNLYAVVKERITVCECGKRFEVTSYRLVTDGVEFEISKRGAGREEYEKSEKDAMWDRD